MTDISKTIERAITLRDELNESQRSLQMKGEVLDGVMKDLFIKELGMPSDAKEIPLPQLLKKVYMAGYEAAKAGK